MEIEAWELGKRILGDFVAIGKLDFLFSEVLIGVLGDFRIGF